MFLTRPTYAFAEHILHHSQISIYEYFCVLNGDTFGWGTALKARRSWVRFPTVPLESFIDIFLPTALWGWGRISFQQKWVPATFPGSKHARCVGLTSLPTSCVNFLEIWGTQPPGTLSVHTGIALPLWQEIQPQTDFVTIVILTE
jgi:hypothetical protein